MLSRYVISSTSRRSFSVLSAVRSEGKPSGSSESSFNKRERAAEEQYIRDHELEKLKALKKSIDASRAHLEQLEKDHKELEKSIKTNDK